MTINWKKNYSWKKILGSKTTIYLSLGLHKERPSYWRSLQLLKEGIQHLQNMKFFNFFLLLWVIFALLDPVPDSESGATEPIESGTHPDPQPCFKCWFIRIRIRKKLQRSVQKSRLRNAKCHPIRHSVYIYLHHLLRGRSPVTKKFLRSLFILLAATVTRYRTRYIVTVPSRLTWSKLLLWKHRIGTIATP
jgi:hypothetical protein